MYNSDHAVAVASTSAGMPHSVIIDHVRYGRYMYCYSIAPLSVHHGMPYYHCIYAMITVGNMLVYVL